MDRLGDGLVYLCRASGEGSHDFRVCPDEASVGAFYQEMTGEDEGGGIDSLWRDFRNPDCWGSDGTALELELYCAKFEVWKVDARQLNGGARVDGVDVPHAWPKEAMDGPKSEPEALVAWLTTARRVGAEEAIKIMQTRLDRLEEMRRA